MNFIPVSVRGKEDRKFGLFQEESQNVPRFNDIGIVITIPYIVLKTNIRLWIEKQGVENIRKNIITGFVFLFCHFYRLSILFTSSNCSA